MNPAEPPKPLIGMKVANNGDRWFVCNTCGEEDLRSPLVAGGYGLQAIHDCPEVTE